MTPEQIPAWISEFRRGPRRGERRISTTEAGCWLFEGLHDNTNRPKINYRRPGWKPAMVNIVHLLGAKVHGRRPPLHWWMLADEAVCPAQQRCVNPHHGAWGTQRTKAPSHHALRETCPQGHPLDGTYTRTRFEWPDPPVETVCRYCKRCRQERDRAYRARLAKV